MPIHYARTPTRIDLAGGWTDVPAFAEVVPGAVLNCAITLYSHVRIADADDQLLRLRSLDYDRATEIAVGHVPRDDELHGPFALALAALRRRPMGRAAHVLTHSEAPPGSGLGTSAAMGVALLGALNTATCVEDDAMTVAETAVALETEDIGILSGKQDHYASALGGVQYMAFDGGKVHHTRLDLSDAETAQLRARVVLVYTGSSRLSSDLHEHVVGRFNAHDPALLSTLAEIAQIAAEARHALVLGKYAELGRCVAANWDCQKRLYDGINTDEIDALAEAGERNGSLGMKACGAGGGGCLIFVARDGHEATLANALRDAGAEVLRYDVAPHGLLTWSRPHAE